MTQVARPIDGQADPGLVGPGFDEMVRGLDFSGPVFGQVTVESEPLLYEVPLKVGSQLTYKWKVGRPIGSKNKKSQPSKKISNPLPRIPTSDWEKEYNPTGKGKSVV